MSGISGCGNIVSDGLVLYLDAANIKSYVSGNTAWYDLSGHKNNGTLVNNVGFSNNNNGVLNFNGVNNTILLPYNESIDPVSGISFETFIYPTDISIMRKYVEIYRREDGNSRHLFSFQEWGTVLSFGIQTTSYQELDVLIDKNNYENKWSHLVATYTNGRKIIYKDGVIIGQSNQNGTLAQSLTMKRSYIGSCDGGTEFFKGNLSIFKIYNRELSHFEVLQNYNALKSRYI